MWITPPLCLHLQQEKCQDIILTKFPIITVNYCPSVFTVEGRGQRPAPEAR